jgi:hypothetical protein
MMLEGHWMWLSERKTDHLYKSESDHHTRSLCVCHIACRKCQINEDTSYIESFNLKTLSIKMHHETLEQFIIYILYKVHTT